MPRIENLPEVLYQPNDPIHWEIDNLPLKNILRRIDLVNMAVDNALEQIREATGTQGSMANRLNQSINEDGSLKTAAIDAALHSIEEHEDTDDYVRMTKSQSDKLDLVASEATDITIQVDNDGSAAVLFDEGLIEIQASDTITPIVEAPNIVKFDLNFSVEAIHAHHYGLTPVHANLITPDFTNYKVNSLATPYIEDSLRVFINGVRIFDGTGIYVPGPLVEDEWVLIHFTPDHEAGTFELSEAITEDDVIRIDFDIALV